MIDLAGSRRARAKPGRRWRLGWGTILQGSTYVWIWENQKWFTSPDTCNYLTPIVTVPRPWKKKEDGKLTEQK